jgi:hypothetical protein
LRMLLPYNLPDGWLAIRFPRAADLTSASRLFQLRSGALNFDGLDGITAIKGQRAGNLSNSPTQLRSYVLTRLQRAVGELVKSRELSLDTIDSVNEPKLAEYAALRDEALKCFDSQRDLVRLNITGSGAVAGLAIADAAAPGLLVILSFLSPVLGLLWIDQDSKIHRIARYVRDELWDWEPSWEKWLVAEKVRQRPMRVLAFAVPTVVVFLLPAVAGLIVSGHHWDDIGGKTVWWLAFIPLFVYILVGIGHLARGNS